MTKDAKEAIGEIIDDLETQLGEEQIKNNRLQGEITKMKNQFARLVEIMNEGAEICRQLRM